jgi:hypothetical protein
MKSKPHHSYQHHILSNANREAVEIVTNYGTVVAGFRKSVVQTMHAMGGGDGNAMIDVIRSVDGNKVVAVVALQGVNKGVPKFYVSAVLEPRHAIEAADEVIEEVTRHLVGRISTRLSSRAWLMTDVDDRYQKFMDDLGWIQTSVQHSGKTRLIRTMGAIDEECPS